MDSEDLAIFVQESGDLLDALEQGLLSLEGGADGEGVHALFRAAHTIKGNAGIVGATAVAQFTHVLEGVLARMRDGVLVATPEVVDSMLESVDCLRIAVRAIASGAVDPGLGDRAGPLVASLRALSSVENAEAAPVPSRESTFRVALALAEGEPPATLRGLVDDLAALGQLISVEPSLDAPDVRQCRLVLRGDLRAADIEGTVIFANATVSVEQIAVPAAPAAPVAGPGPAAAAGQTTASTAVRVDGGRVDRLLELVGELTIALGSMRRAVEDPAIVHRARLEALEALDRLGADVHERVMSLRMVPVGETFERMRRPVRDAAKQLGKDVTLVSEGVDTELDRKLLEELGDPLTHMVRNAVAHGIESPDVRRAAGKPPAGRLTLRAAQRNGAAIIEVEDDGAGIDRPKVLRRAVERGLVAPGAMPTEQETYALLFAPGFSTSETVNQVSGRGVGLDVVVKSVERLRGRVEITSELGKGTTFRIRLPLSLTVQEGVKVRVGRETLSIPLREVDELPDPTITPVHTLEGKAEYVDVRGELVPLVRLGRVLGLDDAAGSGPAASLVVVRSDRRRFALAVDSVVGIARTVVKPLDRSFELCGRATSDFERPASIGGATILDDGLVGYVVDVHGLDATAFR